KTILLKGLTHVVSVTMVAPLRLPHGVVIRFLGGNIMGKSGIGNARRARLDNLREAALHKDVVARRVTAGFNGRWTRRQWAHASLFATLAALVAAIVPGFPADSQAAAA